MEISQKRFSNKTKFEFGDEKLTYTLNDGSTTADFDISYAEFPVNSNSREERNASFRNAGLFWIAAGLFFLIVGIIKESSLSFGGFWLIVGLICLLIFKYTATRYSVHKTDQGTIYILQDKHHDEIVEKINSKKKKQLLSWHGEIDRDQEPEYEIVKYRWLESQGAMTTEEADKKIAQVQWSTKS